MLQRFTDRDLETLIGHRGPSLSILLPTPWRGDEARKVPIALKGALREAETQARERGLSPQQSDALLAPLRRLGEDPAVWREAREGAVLFSSPTLLRAYHLGRAVGPRAVLDERFYLRPLLTELQEPAYNVLAISLNQVRLLACRRDACSRVELVHVPASFEQAMGELQYYTGLQMHSSTSSGLGRRAAIFHGHGDGDEEHFEDDVFAYFRAVARGLEQQMGKSGEPLVLAGVAAHFPALKRAGLPYAVLEEGVAGNPDHVPDHELRDAAWPIVEAWSRRAAAADLERYGELAARAQASSEAHEILQAASAGRIHVLLTASGAELWGRFDPASLSLSVHRERAPGDEELVNLAVCGTLAGRGTARELPAAEVPGGAPMAALFRY